MIFDNKLNKHRALNKAVRPGKNLKLINVGPTFNPESRVCHVFSFCLQK